MITSASRDRKIIETYVGKMLLITLTDLCIAEPHTRDRRKVNESDLEHVSDACMCKQHVVHVKKIYIVKKCFLNFNRVSKDMTVTATSICCTLKRVHRLTFFIW